jgi:hypothetical protein
VSVKVQALIWEFAPYRGNTLLAFLALGDWSDDEGLCWPHMNTLAKKSRQSLRSVQYAVEMLSRDGFLEMEVNPGAGRKNQFKINMQKLRVLSVTQTQKTAEKGAKRDIVIRKNRHDPSIKSPLPPFSKGGISKRDIRTIQKEIERLSPGWIGCRNHERDQRVDSICQWYGVNPDAFREAVNWPRAPIPEYAKKRKVRRGLPDETSS